MDAGPTTTELGDWLDRYGRAWAQADGRAAANLFTEDAVYEWGPFDRLAGHDEIASRWSAETGDQESAVFAAEPEGADGARRFVRWHTIIDDAIELDGFFVLDFAQDGRCRHLQEWWLSRETS